MWELNNLRLSSRAGRNRWGSVFHETEREKIGPRAAKTETRGGRECSCIIGLWFHDGIYKVCSTWRVSSTSELVPTFGVAMLQKRVIIVVIYIPGAPLMRLGVPYWKILRWFYIKPSSDHPSPLSLSLLRFHFLLLCGSASNQLRHGTYFSFPRKFEVHGNNRDCGNVKLFLSPYEK